MKKFYFLITLLILFTFNFENKANAQANCITTWSSTANPVPAAGNVYQCGTVVTFCYTLSGWTGGGAQYLHGFPIFLGPGWNAASLTPITFPNDCGGPSPPGGWGFFNSCSPTGFGAPTVWGPGFYYDGNGGSGIPGNGIPGDNWGDGGNCTWTLCFSVQVSAVCNNQSLSVTIAATGDGVTGSWGGGAGVCNQNWINPNVLCTATCSCCQLIITPVVINSTCNQANGSVSVSTTGGSGSYTYTLMPNNIVIGPAATANFTNLLPGAYSVNVSDGNGCFGTANFVITSTTPPTVTITPAAQSICNGSNATMTASGANNGYNWYNGSPPGTLIGPGVSINVSPSTTSTYSVIGLDANGCSDTASTIITVNPIPTSSFSFAPNPVCAGFASTITYTGSASAAGSYSWTFANGTPNSANTQGPHNVIWANAGNYNVTLSVTENNCTSVTTTNSINVKPIPSSAFVVTTPICQGTSSAITYIGGSPASATYNWNFAGGNPSTANTQGPQNITYNGTGTQNVTLTVTDSGCTSPLTQLTLYVTQTPTSNFTLPANICFGQPVSATYTGNAAPTAIYGWNITNLGTLTPGGTTQGPQALTFPQPSPPNYTVNLTVSDSNCISTLTSNTIFVTQIPTATFTVSSPKICPSGTETITYTGNAPATAAYNWNFGGGTPATGNTQNPGTVSFAASGTHLITLQVTDNVCPSFIDSVYFDVDTLATIIATLAPPTGCDSVIVQFSNSSVHASNCLWKFGDGSSVNEPGNSVPPPHTYYNGNYNIELVATTLIGCKDSMIIGNVNVIPTPTAAFAASPDINVMTELKNATFMFTNNSTNANSYQWFFGDGDSTSQLNPIHTYGDTGHYSVMLIAINQYGCLNVVTQGPYIVIPNNNYFIPNAFTPNHDGVNDEFHIFGNNFTSIYMTIFDRWGNKVFETHDMTQGWDGKYHNQLVAGGVFVYYAEIEYYNGEKLHLKGDVTVLK